MATVCVQQVSNLCLCVSLYITFVRFICVCVCVAVLMVPALSSVLQQVRLHTERDWFLPTGPVKASGSLCDGPIHLYTQRQKYASCIESCMCQILKL